MNALNALIFFLLGVAMETLPAAFPSMFPRTCADQASLSSLFRMLAVPVLVRLISTAPAGEREAVALPTAPGIPGR
jgi:hypothetical protein